jgi:hypothetical protein
LQAETLGERLRNSDRQAVSPLLNSGSHDDPLYLH